MTRKKNRVVKGLCNAFNITIVMQRNQSAHIPCIIRNFGHWTPSVYWWTLWKALKLLLSPSWQFPRWRILGALLWFIEEIGNDFDLIAHWHEHINEYARYLIFPQNSLIVDRRYALISLECFRSLVYLWSLKLFPTHAQHLNHTNFNSPPITLPSTTLAAATMLPACA